MRENASGAWLPHLLESFVRGGLRHAYRRVQLNPKKYLRHARRAYGLPIKSWHDVHSLDESLLNRTAARVVRSSARTAALEGMGLGIGGITTLVPDMGILSAITIRMLQKLSLIYGFEYSTDDEIAALWVAAASAAGLDLTREFLEKQAVERVVPRIVDAGRPEAGRGSRRKMGRAGRSHSQRGRSPHRSITILSAPGDAARSSISSKGAAFSAHAGFPVHFYCPRRSPASSARVHCCPFLIALAGIFNS